MTLQETFDQLDWQAVFAFVDQKQEENLHLDFKLVANSELTNKDDKRNFAKALSGFANSSGGIIVWGIDARKNADGIDCATAIAELTNPALMVTRLNSMTGDASSPLIDGIRHKAIINPQTGHGVVATLVPENDAGPFMAKLGEQRYYKRSGDSFYQMEHFDLEDMFGRRRKAALKFNFEHSKADDGTERLSIRLQNAGRAVARYAGFLAEFQNVELIEVDGSLRNASNVNAVPIVQYDNNLGVIHPNGVLVHIGTVQFRRIQTSQNVVLSLNAYCEGSQRVESKVQF